MTNRPTDTARAAGAAASTATLTPGTLSPLGSARLRLDAQAAFAPAAGVVELGVRGPGELGLDLDPQDAFLAFEVAGWATGLAPAERRRFERLIAGLLGQIAEGSTRIAVGPADQTLLARLPELVGAPGANTPFILTEGCLAPHRLYAAESRLATALGARLRDMASGGRFDPTAVAKAVADAAATGVPRPSDEQQRAVATALAGRLGVITGGPGTGKTTVVLTLVRTLARLGVPSAAIALAAPTGKAANRLGEAMRGGLVRLGGAAADDARLLAAPPVPETLHRLLRHSPSARAFAHREGTPLPFAVVIVDESSMIDLALMDRLVAALAPDTLLVLLGDADQLPSVEAGAVFRDLALLGVRLEQSHRMDPRRPEGRRILGLAGAVKAGARDLGSLLDRRPSAAAVQFDGVELCPGADLDAFVARWFDDKLRAPALRDLAARTFEVGDGEPGEANARFAPEAIALFDEAFDHHQRYRLLAVTRGRPTGTDALNAFMHARAGGRLGSWIAGEPVMMLRNDYDRGLWNGDQGLIVSLRDAIAGSRARLGVVFKIDGRWTPFPLDGLRDTLSLAFALTVHKAQGSEYDEVALVLPSAPHPLLSRDLIYTALTRCRNAVALCGEESVLLMGIGHAIQRTSGLSIALAP
jgi:exodeoxyribonuclease V alpha subunit